MTRKSPKHFHAKRVFIITQRAQSVGSREGERAHNIYNIVVVLLLREKIHAQNKQL